MKRSKRYRTRHPGVFYREHESRKYNGKPDRYYVLRYRVNHQLKEEGLGWASQRKGLNAETARDILAELRSAQTKGEDGQTLKERREMKVKRDQAEKARKEREARDQLTFGEIFTKHYLPATKIDKKFSSYDGERGLFENWLQSILGNRPLREIGLVQIQELKKKMRKAKKAPRTIEYAIAVLRQVFNFSRDAGLFDGDNPKIKMKKFDNKRIRFLTPEEADSLLEALKKEDPEVWEHALISSRQGLRASEIFNLTWGDVNLEQQMLIIRDAKAGSRTSEMFPKVQEMFSKKTFGKPRELVYPTANGKKRKAISKVFAKVVEELKFNDGVTDRRQKVVFHTLRHSWASWLLEAGQDIYTVAKLGGWKSLSIAGRYTHLFDGAGKRAVLSLEQFLESKKEDKTDKPESKVALVKKK